MLCIAGFYFVSGFEAIVYNAKELNPNFFFNVRLLDDGVARLELN